MAQRRRAAKDEILLVPFLDILCSLIGVLILIIVVLSVAQSQQTNGRTPQDIDQAKKYQQLVKQKKAQSKDGALLKEKLATLDQLQKDSDEKEQKLVRLRKLFSTSAEIQKTNKELSQTMLKELDNLLLEIQRLTTQEADSKKDIAALMAELKTRAAPPQKTVPPVMVQPGGSGLAAGTKLFFVEASAGKLTLYWDQQKKTIVPASPDVIAADEALNHFLKTVLTVPQSRIIFLMRDDGMGAYNNGAGWAQATFGYKVDQIGKLPIPGRGPVDLQMFKDHLGTLPPPPEAKLVPAPLANPAPPKTA